MQTKPLGAVYEHGMLRLLEEPDLAEGEEVLVTIAPKRGEPAVDALAALQRVFEGLSEEEIEEFERHLKRPKSMFELDDDRSN